ncbi:CcdB family protein [Frateuria defendens]|uniref:CcdB family protein n=1 Tax=Frateuria defendens TaxID=2219559 RepID=UPI00066FC1E4|nr:CcdB family protein [Frateuria defendens]
MARFDVYRNEDAASSKRFPYLLAVQSELLDGLHTCVVVPLGRASAVGGKPMERLMPGLALDGETWLMYTPQLAAVRTAILRKRIGNLSDQGPAILAALDFLFSGI